MKIIICLLLLFLFSNNVFANTKERYPFKNERQQQQFQRLTRNMRCMVCQNQNLASSTAGFANDMRREIYQMVQQGKTDRQITKYMTTRYGYFVSFDPPFNWETYLLWLGPILLIIIGFFIVRSVHRKYRNNS